MKQQPLKGTSDLISHAAASKDVINIKIKVTLPHNLP